MNFQKRSRFSDFERAKVTLSRQRKRDQQSHGTSNVMARSRYQQWSQYARDPQISHG